MSLEIFPIHINKEIGTGNDLAEIILSSCKIKEGDVLIVAQKIISKQEGLIIDLDSIIPSLLAQGIAAEYGKDVRVVEAILSESDRIVRMKDGVIITQTKHGFICANAGVDESNVERGFITLLPKDPDESARSLQDQILKKTKKSVAVIISDTFGRPFRLGQTNCAIGVSGIDTILDYAGKSDNFGRSLRVTAISLVDELCSAAELVMGKLSRHPAAIIRGYEYTRQDNATIKSLLRQEDSDLFR